MDNDLIPQDDRADRLKTPRKAVLFRDENQCQKCARTDGLEVHHIIPVCEGGTNAMDNLITLCSGCHGEWHSTEKVSKLKFEHWLEYPPVHRLIVMLDHMKSCDFLDAALLKQLLRSAILNPH